MSNDKTFYILDADKLWARSRIAEIEKAIDDLGPEFEEAFNQSSETWHDNAPFDALRDRQSVMSAERHSLRIALNKASTKCPKPARNRVGIGSTVTITEGSKTQKYFIAGNWSPNIGEVVDGAFVVSCASPLGQAMLNLGVGKTAVVQKPPRQLLIKEVQN